MDGNRQSEILETRERAHQDSNSPVPPSATMNMSNKSKCSVEQATVTDCPGPLCGTCPNPSFDNTGDDSLLETVRLSTSRLLTSSLLSTTPEYTQDSRCAATIQCGKAVRGNRECRGPPYDVSTYPLNCR